MNYLRKHPKSGNWYFRRTIPAALRPGFGGRHDWNESLKTKSYEEAKSRAIAVAARVEVLFQQARDKLAGKPPAMGIDVQTVTKLVTNWRDTELHRRATALLAGPLGDNHQFQRECRALGVAGHEEPLTLDKKGFDHLDDYDRTVNEKVVEIARNAGWLLTMDQPAFTVMWHMVRDNWVTILETERKWRNFDYTNLPVAAPPASVAVPLAHVPLAQGGAAVRTGGATILEVYQNYAAERRISVKLRAEHATIFKRLTETVGGDVPIRRVTKAQIVDFKALLYKVPVAIKTAQRRLPIRELIAAFEGRDTPRLSQGSVIKNMVIVSTVFGWAHDNGYLDANPVSGTIPTRTKVAAATRRQPYSAADIKLIFSSPIWTGCRSDEKYWEPGNHVVRDERYWLPILALFTGARLGELAQLLRSDLRQEGDVWYIDITTTSDEEDQEKRLKTASSHRKVPLHPVLIRLGFPDYARPIQSGRMFPRLKPDRFGSFAESFGKLWARYCDRIGMPDRRKVFHSFRHNFKDACRAAGISEEVHDALTGHAGGGVGRSYGNGVALARLAQEIARIVYPSFPM